MHQVQCIVKILLVHNLDQDLLKGESQGIKQIFGQPSKNLSHLYYIALTEVKGYTRLYYDKGESQDHSDLISVLDTPPRPQ